MKDLKWVAIPNRHDGEHFTQLMAHKRGAEIFSAFVLMLQIASKCNPRGTLIRSNGTPHTGTSMSVKCRAPVSWFEVALEYLELNTDWLEIEDVNTKRQEADSMVPSSCQSGAQEGKEGKEGKEGITAKATFSIQEVFNEWNSQAALPQCLVISDKRRRLLEVRLREPFFLSNWKAAIIKLSKTRFCLGDNDRGWTASFDWILQPDTVARIMEGKYDGTNKNNGASGSKGFDRNKGTANEGRASDYDLGKIQAARAVRDSGKPAA